jgi:hypothetical protein
VPERDNQEMTGINREPVSPGIADIVPADNFIRSRGAEQAALHQWQFEGAAVRPGV